MEEANNIETFEFLASRWPRILVINAMIILNGISKKELAEESNINTSSMWMTTQGKRRHPRAMAALSRAFGIPARELFDGMQS